jgi:hypothetical protein
LEGFNHLSVLLAIILGLAITQILSGFRGLVHARARIRMYWPAITWAWLLLVIDVQTWWAMFGLRNHRDWTFGQFAVVLLQTIILYMLAALILPDFGTEGSEPFDLRESYFRQARWFYCLAFLAGIVSLCKDLALEGALPDRMNVGFHIVFLLTAAGAVLTRREGYHKVAVLAMAFLFALYITMLFARLR